MSKASPLSTSTFHLPSSPLPSARPAPKGSTFSDPGSLVLRPCSGRVGDLTHSALQLSGRHLLQSAQVLRTEQGHPVAQRHGNLADEDPEAIRNTRIARARGRRNWGGVKRPCAHHSDATVFQCHRFPLSYRKKPCTWHAQRILAVGKMWGLFQ